MKPKTSGWGAPSDKKYKIKDINYQGQLHVLQNTPWPKVDVVTWGDGVLILILNQMRERGHICLREQDT